MDFFTFDSEVWTKLVGLLQYDSMSPMSLASGFFLFAFLIFGLGYMAVRNHRTMRTLYVVIISAYFYYKISGLYLLLLFAVAISDYLIGCGIARCIAKGKRGRGLVALSMIINISILAYFKVGGLFEEAINSLFGSGTINLGAIVVPAGVSFFVFQSISYVIDISRGVISPVKRFIDYLFLLSFFPKVFLGPLVRNKEFIPQIERESIVVTRQDHGRAVVLIASGLIKYAVIAKAIDSILLIPAVSGEFGESGVVMLVALYGFGIRLYCDFSGYSDIAIGIALVMGYKLPDNFDAPFKSATITEFWRRWHISLSSWLRDYLYISLGGNRKGKVRTYLNLIITMVLGGLWHGAAVRFVLWGALHGVALALHKMWLAIVPWAKANGKDMNPVVRLFGIILTFNIVCLGWLLFRAEDMQTVHLMLYQIFHSFNTAIIPQVVLGYKEVFALIVIGYGMHFMPAAIDSDMQRKVASASFWWQVALIVMAAWCVMQIKSSGIQPFIYFQF